MIKPTQAGVSAPNHYQETQDCSVRSIANASNQTYEEAHTLLKSLGRKNGCTVSGHTLAAACLRSGGRLKLFRTDFIEQYQIAQRNLTRYLPYMKDGKFVVILPHHAFTVINGCIIDNQSTDEKETVISVYEFK